MSHPSIGALGAGSREDFEADVVLRDGSTVRVRAVRTADESPLLEFLRDLSPPSRTLRFGGGVSDYYLRQAAGRLARDDSEHALGLIAMSGPVASYGCVCTYAEMLGYDEAHELLGQNLDEEETTDERLTALAESVINIEAEEGSGEGEDSSR